MCRSTSYARVTRPLCWTAFIRRSLVTLFIHLDILIRLETLRKVENLIFSCAICQIGLESELPRIRVDSFVLLISFVTRKLASVDQSVYESTFLLCLSLFFLVTLVCPPQQHYMGPSVQIEKCVSHRDNKNFDSIWKLMQKQCAIHFPSSTSASTHTPYERNVKDFGTESDKIFLRSISRQPILSYQISAKVCVYFSRVLSAWIFDDVFFHSGREWFFFSNY